MCRHSRIASLLLLSCMVLTIGCSGPDSKDGNTTKDVNTTDEPSADASAKDASKNGKNGDGAFVLGDLIDKFDPPTLEELEEKAEWIDKP
ncbi:MAG: hypothetical protein IH991_19245, partial [Planctomycetes bacterium]|nr:hypothetical protein [Planctomycetota bacterium]